jgi:hypothetical protein
MKSVNKFLLGLATVVTIIAPLVPKTVNINISLESPSNTSKVKKTQIVENVCNLTKRQTTTQGLLDCEYQCSPSHIKIHKIYYSQTAICQAVIIESVREKVSK